MEELKWCWTGLSVPFVGCVYRRFDGFGATLPCHLTHHLHDFFSYWVPYGDQSNVTLAFGLLVGLPCQSSDRDG